MQHCFFNITKKNKKMNNLLSRDKRRPPQGELFVGVKIFF